MSFHVTTKRRSPGSPTVFTNTRLFWRFGKPKREAGIQSAYAGAASTNAPSGIFQGVRLKLTGLPKLMWPFALTYTDEKDCP
jgi:hypothetical protein